MPLHVLPAGELLATDFTGVGPLAGVGAHVPLQDALVHSRETAVGALELFTDHREIIHCGHRSRGEGGREERQRGGGEWVSERVNSRGVCLKQTRRCHRSVVVSN